jgi:hypothetical protein
LQEVLGRGAGGEEYQEEQRLVREDEGTWLRGDVLWDPCANWADEVLVQQLKGVLGEGAVASRFVPGIVMDTYRKHGGAVSSVLFLPDGLAAPPTVVMYPHHHQPSGPAHWDGLAARAMLREGQVFGAVRPIDEDTRITKLPRQA